MTPEEEKEYWRRLIADLRRLLTVSELAEKSMVDDRQVYRWLEGDRPKGLTAIRVYTLHVKLCPQGHDLRAIPQS